MATSRCRLILFLEDNFTRISTVKSMASTYLYFRTSNSTLNMVLVRIPRRKQMYEYQYTKVVVRSRKSKEDGHS